MNDNRDCKVPHFGACDAVVPADAVLVTVEAYGFDARLNDAGEVEAWEPCLVFPFDGSGPRDESKWIPVPRVMHALIAWLAGV